MRALGLTLIAALIGACGGNSSTDTDAAVGGECGNNTIEGQEFCDGADLRSETCTTLGLGGGTLACQSDCRFDFTGCEGQPMCGNGDVEGVETCDDGGTADGDGCDANCQQEIPQSCGDNILNNAIEQCDDGNNDNNDGCDATCKLEPVGLTCGDNTVDTPLEKCDPPEAMPANGDGCNATCNLSGVVTTLTSTPATAMTTDNATIYLGIHDVANGCGIASIDIAACTAAPGTAACNPTWVTGGTVANCENATGSCPSDDLVPAPEVVDGDKNTATFDFIGSIATDGTTLWFGNQQQLRSVNLATGDVSTVAGKFDSCGAIDGTGTAGYFYGIRGLTFWNDQVYLLDGCEDVLRSFNPATRVLSTVAGMRDPSPAVVQQEPYTCPVRPTTDAGNANCYPNYCNGPNPNVPSPGIGLNSVFVSPRYLTPDYKGNLYIIDTNGNAIFRYNTVSTQADILVGQSAPAMPNPYNDGAAVNATLHRPRGIISDGTSVYFAEQVHATLRQLELGAMEVTTFVGTDGCSAGQTQSRDGTGANTEDVWSLALGGNRFACSVDAGNPPLAPPAGTPIFNQLFGEMAFHFPTRSIYMLDGGLLRRIE